MAKLKGICKNIDGCDLAADKIEQEAEKSNFICSECGKPLTQVGKVGGGKGPNGGDSNKKLLIIVIAIVIVIGGGAGAWFGGLFGGSSENLVEPCILAGCPIGGTVVDPFAGSGTTGATAKRVGRNFIGVEINEKYCAMAADRIAAVRVAENLIDGS